MKRFLIKAYYVIFKFSKRKQAENPSDFETKSNMIPVTNINTDLQLL